jgi:arylsulfatase A-like enzyme
VVGGNVVSNGLEADPDAGRGDIGYAIRKGTAMNKRVVLSLLFVYGAVGPVQAYQPDVPYLKLAERNKAKWAAEDKQIDARLAALEKRFGKKPNIIYVLADDVGWGELGWQGGGKHRGTPTPVLDKMASEGIRFWCAYAEPSCTPSRIAINTGRHPVRTGLLSVLWPGQTEGLSPEEVTVAEVLSEAGYRTAMWGKWHMGDLPEHAPENQGYDYAYYGLWNGAPDDWPGSYNLYKDGPSSSSIGLFYDFPGEEEYLKRTGIDLSVAGYVGRKGQGRKPIEGVAGKLGPDRQEAFEAESIKQITAYIKENAKSDKPFFIYWATFTQQLQGSKAHYRDKYVDKVNVQASEMAAHNAHMKQMFDTLKSEGIAENTLVVWISDNGPMYAFYPNSGYSWLRGGERHRSGGRRARSGNGLVAGHDRARSGSRGYPAYNRPLHDSSPPGRGA